MGKLLGEPDIFRALRKKTVLMTEPQTLQLADFEDAAVRLEGIIHRTPLVPFRSFENDSTILLKLEIHQPITSFKIRGVFHAVSRLSADERKAGISTVSAGNTAQAVAWAGRFFGVPAQSVMPETAPASKIEAVRRLGGTPVLKPMEEVFRYLKEHLWEKEPYSFIHPWTNRNVRIGHGSMGLEILHDRPDAETVFIPVGGGGLMGGVGAALKLLKPEIKIVAVEPEGCPSFHTSLRQGKPATVDCNTICDGVAVPYMTEEMFPVLKELADDTVLVSERMVKSYVKRLALHDKIVVEPSAALAVAAADNYSENEKGIRVALVTGGSIDAEKFTGILNDPDL